MQLIFINECKGLSKDTLELLLLHVCFFVLKPTQDIPEDSHKETDIKYLKNELKSSEGVVESHYSEDVDFVAVNVIGKFLIMLRPLFVVLNHMLLIVIHYLGDIKQSEALDDTVALYQVEVMLQPLTYKPTNLF